MDDFHTVCQADDVKEGVGKTVSAGGKLIALFRINGELCAIDDVCPHMGASLSDGCVEGNIVTCPWHAWRFRVTDGTWADNPRIKIGCYSVRLDNGAVQIQVPKPPGTAAKSQQP